MEKRNRISAGYLEQQRQLHENPKYGVASLHYARIVQELLTHYKLGSVSDYGAGKQRLREALERLGAPRFEYFPYDPVFPEYGEPRPAELVCCIDVLEHVEPDCLDSVLRDLEEITTKYAFMSVHSKPAMKLLPDGRNAHLTQKPSSWWLPRLCRHFEIEHLKKTDDGFWVVATRRADDDGAASQ